MSRWQKNLKFADKQKIYNMSVPNSSIELIRLREMRQALMDLIELMKRDQWLPEDSEAASDLDAAFLKLYNEFATIYQAQLDDDEKRNLFGRNPSFIPGEKFKPAKRAKNLIVGDIFQSTNFDCEVTYVDLDYTVARLHNGYIRKVYHDEYNDNLTYTYIRNIYEV